MLENKSTEEKKQQLDELVKKFVSKYGLDSFKEKVDINLLEDVYVKEIYSYDSDISLKWFLKFLAIDAHDAFSAEESAASEIRKMQGTGNYVFLKESMFGDNWKNQGKKEKDIYKLYTNLEQAKKRVSVAKNLFWEFRNTFSEKIRVFPSYVDYLVYNPLKD